MTRSPHFLSHDVHVHRGGVSKKLVYRGKIEISLPPLGRRPSENHLSNVILAYEFRNLCRNNLSLALNDLRAHTLGETNVVCQGTLVLVTFVRARVYIEYEQIAIQCLGHARSTRNQILRCGIRTDAHSNLLAHLQRPAVLCLQLR